MDRLLSSVLRWDLCNATYGQILGELRVLLLFSITTCIITQELPISHRIIGYSKTSVIANKGRIWPTQYM